MTASNLILKTPTAIKKKRAKVEETISKIDGVKEVKELLIWEMAKSKIYTNSFIYREICCNCGSYNY